MPSSLVLSAPGFNFSTLPALQSSCPFFPSKISNPSFSVVSVLFLRSSVLCDVYSGSPRPVVPSTLRHQLFLALHGLSHPGARPYQRLLFFEFVWPGLAKDVGLWTRSCLRCQQSKIQSHVKSSIPRITVPGRRFFLVHLDLVGPLPSSQGFNYLLTMINGTLQWREAVPLSSITSKACARACISMWVSRFEVPALLTLDQGFQFTSSVCSEVCPILGISRIKTTSFHPQSNGMIERFHHSLKSSI